jgi:predicted metal-dependent phosphoesterase TrpH
VPLTWDEVVAVAPPGANVGRPHFAQALVQKGVVGSAAEAFERFLGDGAPAYVPKAVLSPADAIALIHAAGGLAFLAHPGLLRLGPGESPRDRLRALQALGLDGVEAYYPQHTLPQTERFRDLARDLGLLVTGGSDFHGANKPDAALGAVVDGHGVPLPDLPAELR